MYELLFKCFDFQLNSFKNYLKKAEYYDVQVTDEAFFIKI